MAPDNDWLSFSLQSSMEMLNPSSHHHPIPPPSQHFYDNFYAAADDVHGWANQKSESMYSGSETHRHDHPQQNSFSVFNGYMQPPPPKLEDFFSGGDSAETHGDSSLTQIYEHHHNAAYFGGFQANSGSEVDDSAAFQQTESPVESGAELVPYSQSHCPVVDSSNNNSNNTAIVSGDANHKKIADNFGQRTSIYRGVTRHRWTGRYEAHLWDNSCRREGQARKGRQVYLGGYDKEDRAARSYDLAALKYWGSTATTNFPASNYATEIEEMKNATRQEFIASLRRKSSGFSRGASMYRGVTRHHQQGRWQARIGRVAGNKDLYLGTFATEEEAAEAYDIAAIKFRGLNAVTNFEMNRYDVEAIAQSPLPIGGTAKRLKLSLEAQEKFNTTAFHTPLSNGGSSSSISFSDVQSANSAIIPCGVPFDSTSPFYHHNFFHHPTPASESSMTTPMNLVSSTPEFFIWPHQSY